MKIVFITTFGRACGLSSHAEHLAEEWVRAGHEVAVLNEAQDKEPMRSDAPDVPVISAWKQTDIANDCLKHIMRLHPDVVVFAHAWEYLSPSVIEQLANGCHQQGCAFVVAWHNLVGYRSSLQETPQIDAHIVFNPDGVKHLVSVGVPADKVLYLPHGCPHVNEVDPPKCRNRVATFGLMYPSKGIEQTITAVDVARKLSGRDITLDIYASHNAWTELEYLEYRAEIDRLIAFKGMSSCVNIFTGFLSEPGLFRALCDADVLMYLYHHVPHRLSSSAVLSFSFATGKPVIVSDIPHFHGTQQANDARIAVNDAHEAGERLVSVLGALDILQSIESEECPGELGRQYARNWQYSDHARVCAEFLGALADTVKRLPVYHPPAKIVAEPVAYTVIAAEYRTRIGVVIATKDRPEQLRTAIESCGEVTGMVVDDGSLRAACVQKAAKRTGFGLLRSDKSHGPSWARNRGVAAIESEWIQFLDDDDILMADWYARLETYLADFDVIIGCALVPERNQLVVKSDVFTSQMCVRRTMFEAVGGFLENCKWAEERDMLGRMESRMARVKRLSVPTVIRPVIGGSGTPPPAKVRPGDAVPDFTSKGF